MNDPLDDVVVEVDLPPPVVETGQCTLEFHPGELAQCVDGEGVEMDGRGQAALQFWWQRIADGGILKDGIKLIYLSETRRSNAGFSCSEV